MNHLSKPEGPLQRESRSPSLAQLSNRPDTLQLLGLAFASADLAFEVGGDGIITFAMGAANQMLGVAAHALVGWDWRAFVDPTDVSVLELILTDLAAGERRGGIRLKCVSVAEGRQLTPAELAVFRLPGRNGRISCAFRRRDGASAGDRPAMNGLLDRADFESVAKEVLQEAVESGAPLHLDLVELPGFAASQASLSVADRIKAKQNVADALRAGAHGGFVAAELATDRYALMRSTEAGQLLARLERLSGAAVTCASQSLSLADQPAHSLRAIRFALDRHIEAGSSAAGEAFQSVLSKTLRRAEAFRDALTKIGRAHV